jgi:hypothetical protein
MALGARAVSIGSLTSFRRRFLLAKASMIARCIRLRWCHIPRRQTLLSPFNTGFSLRVKVALRWMGANAVMRLYLEPTRQAAPSPNRSIGLNIFTTAIGWRLALPKRQTRSTGVGKQLVFATILSALINSNHPREHPRRISPAVRPEKLRQIRHKGHWDR